MRNETTDFEQGEQCYVSNGMALQLTTVEKIVSRNTRGGIRISVHTAGGGVWTCSGGSRGTWGTDQLVKRTPESDRQYACEQAMRRIDRAARELRRDPTRYTPEELFAIEAAIKAADAGAAARAGDPK